METLQRDTDKQIEVIITCAMKIIIIDSLKTEATVSEKKIKW